MQCHRNNLPPEFSTNQLHYILFQERTKKENLTYIFGQQSNDDHTSVSASESMILPINVYNCIKEVITLNQTMELGGLYALW